MTAVCMYVLGVWVETPIALNKCAGWLARTESNISANHMSVRHSSARGGFSAVQDIYALNEK